MPIRGRLIAQTAVLLVAFISPASAQTAPKPLPPAPPEVMEPPNENPVPKADPDAGKAEKPLTKELKENEGVLEPPRGVDPGIQKPVPEDFKGTTPVIPPPGEPGGAPAPQPK